MCLICKTKVAKVYVDDRGNEIENFERRARSLPPRPSPASSPTGVNITGQGLGLGHQGPGQGQGAAEYTPARPSSADRRSSLALAATPQETMSPLAGLAPLESTVLQSAAARRAEKEAAEALAGDVRRDSAGNAMGDPMLAAMAGEAPPPSGGRRASSASARRDSGQPPKADESQANIQFNLQMWIHGLIATNETLREDLGLPLHVKSTQKIMNLMNTSQALAISEINTLVQFAQEQTEENTSLQRLVEASDEEGGGHGKKRPRPSPKRGKAASPARHRALVPVQVQESNELSWCDSEPTAENRGRTRTQSGDSRQVPAPPSAPPSVQGTPVQGQGRRRGQAQGEGTNHKEFNLFPSDGTASKPLGKAALGHREDKLAPILPPPSAETSPSQRSKADKSSKAEPNFVKISKNNGKGESPEAIVKHDKIAHRKEFARNMYKSTK
jgi:hypothetical protein